MKTINIADGLFITYEVSGITFKNPKAVDCLIHVTGSLEEIIKFTQTLDDLDIDFDDVTLQLYCQEHLDGFHK